MFAADKGYTDIVRVLLIKGADVNITNDEGWSAFKVAKDKKRTVIAKFLKRAGGKMAATPLRRKEKDGVLAALMEEEPGGDINSNLITAAIEGDVAGIQALLEQGADVNAKDSDGATALIFAASEGHKDVVKVLLDSGADVNATDFLGQNALVAASDGDYTEIAMLIEKVSVKPAVEAPPEVKKAPVKKPKKLKDYEIEVMNEELISAVRRGEKDAVETLLNRGADPNTKDRNGSTPLMEASIYDYADIVDILLVRGADVDRKDNSGGTALMMAVISGNTDIIQTLLARDADPKAEDRNGMTPLMEATLSGYTEIVELLQPSGPPAAAEKTPPREPEYEYEEDEQSPQDETVDEGYSETAQPPKRTETLAASDPPSPSPPPTPSLSPLEPKKEIKIDPIEFQKLNLDLISAAKEGNANFVKAFIERGADVNAEDVTSKTALMWAAEKGRTNIIPALLGRNADVNARDRNGYSVLMLAVGGGHAGTVKVLLDNGADVNAQSNKGNTALMWAADRGSRDIVDTLLANNADVNAKDKDGWTALMAAVMRGHTDIVRFLLDKGADVEAKDKNGGTAMAWAERGGKEDIVELLEQAESKGKKSFLGIW